MTKKGMDMTDIEQLLRRMNPSHETTPSAEVVEADVRRGHAAMVRRRRRRAVWSVAAGAVAVAAIVSGTRLGGSSPAPRPASVRAHSDPTPPLKPGSGPKQGAGHTQRPGHTQKTGHKEGPRPKQGSGGRPGSGHGRGSGIRLVAYTGNQPAGFIVDEAPQGWYIQPQEHASYSLTIAPDGDTTSADAYVNKLVVTLLSSTVPQKLPNEGIPIEVNGQPGVISNGTPATTLTYRYPDDRYVQIQAWENLGWNDNQLIHFAEGVTVTSAAKAGSG